MSTIIQDLARQRQRADAAEKACLDLAKRLQKQIDATDAAERMTVPVDQYNGVKLMLDAAEQERDYCKKDRDLVYQCNETLSETVAELRNLLESFGKRKQFPELCFCDTLDGTWCVGQQRCKDTNAALAKGVG